MAFFETLKRSSGRGQKAVTWEGSHHSERWMEQMIPNVQANYLSIWLMLRCSLHADFFFDFNHPSWSSRFGCQDTGMSGHEQCHKAYHAALALAKARVVVLVVGYERWSVPALSMEEKQWTIHAINNRFLKKNSLIRLWPTHQMDLDPVAGSLSFAGQWQDGETTSGAGCPCSATRGVSCWADTIATGAVCGWCSSGVGESRGIGELVFGGWFLQWEQERIITKREGFLLSFYISFRIYDDLWWFMMIYDDLWWFMT